MLSMLAPNKWAVLLLFVTCLATAQESGQPETAIKHVQMYLQ
jgi:hypothetical protein